MKTILRSAGLALLAMVVLVPNANAVFDAAQIEKCQRTIAKANAQYLQARVKALGKCNEGIVKGSIASCPDLKAQAALDKATTKLTEAIGKSCGADDQTCNREIANDLDEPTSAQLEWPSQCPNLEKGECREKIKTCSDIIDCLRCIGDAAVDQEMTLLYGDLVLPSTSNKPLNKCQVAIGKATTAFLNSRSKALQKCWDARIKGKHALDCFPPSVGDGKYQAAIDKAEAKKVAAICKACGGADQLCDGTNDIDPPTIGFPTECSRVVEPHVGGADCFGTITDLDSLVACVDCVTSFKTSCVDALQVPQLTPYPTECNSCTLPPPTGACPTSLTFTAEGQKVDLDTGFTGQAHDAKVPTNGRITLNVTGCTGVAQPTCGECSVNGPIDNAGGVTFNNHRCRDASWVQCSTDSDCTTATQCVGGANNGTACTTASECPGGSCDNAGFVGPCIFFFGSPLPLRAGGSSTCVVNQINGPVTGTINLNDGTSTNNVPLSSKVFFVGGEFDPCPQCNSGICSAGPRKDHACTINGSSQYGNVSLDCPPNPGSIVGTLGINLNLSTDTQAKTVTTANATCRGTGFNGLRCLCDTCNTAAAEACSTNVDCPPSGGAPGICGGRRCSSGSEDGKPCSVCLGGTNHGANCTVASQCPSGTCSVGCAGGGQCGRPGEATQPNSCTEDSTTPDLDCEDGGDNEGFCATGPSEKGCSIQTFHSCASDKDCNPAIAPPDGCGPNCLPDQVCSLKPRPCFLDNGKVNNSVMVSGRPDTPCDGIAKPTVGTFFCVAPTISSAVNSAGGLPGLGRVSIPGIVEVFP